MSPNSAIDQDALYYLYVNNEWAGPFQVSQIRDQVAKGTVQAADTYAYAAAQQRHYTVDELLAANTAPAPAEDASGTTSGGITQGMPALFDEILEMAPQTSAAFDNILPDLKALYVSYLGLTEHTAEPQQALKDLHAAHQGLIQELDHRRNDTNTLSRIINEIDEVGDYLANRHQLTHLWQLLSEMEKVDLRTKPDDGVDSARAVLATLVGHAETKVAGSENGTSSSVLLDLAGLDDEADSVITRKILLSARSEVANTKRDMDVLQQTYNELQDQHAKDLEKARKLLEKAEAARAEERHTARQTAAEVRNLAAEIQRLACEPDIAGGSDQELAEQVARLGEELKTADASTLAYMAEDVLIRMVSELRQLAASGSSGTTSDAAPLRAELARARESLAQAQAQVAQLTTERDTLRLQYEQSRITAEKASERAKDREHRLRSTVTALEVTKELHMEVMEDLKSQLQTAQGRVEHMERDLASVRGEMKDSNGTVEARGKAIQHEMQRMVEMKAMLEVRSNELSESLKTAEDELAKAQSSQTSEDTTLAEALAAKVTQLRTTYEATTNRLREQEANAARLASELEASRREADELRGRGDQLSSELGEARGSLSAAKHRLDELHQAYARLEKERESLHIELHQRKSTDTIHKQPAADHQQTDHINRLEHESALLQRQLTAERRQAEQLAETRQSLQSRISELMAEREELRRKFEGLQNEHFNDHARHTAAIAVSTQAAIESERRLRDLQNRVAELEARLAAARKGTEGDSLEPTTARVANPNNALESVEQEHLRAELQQVARERDQVLAQLETIRTSTTARGSEVPENVAQRLVELERELTSAKANISTLDERHAQAVAERDRLRREAERLKGERESAAVEHRTALKSARDRLIESQERVAQLERKLSDHAAGERDGQALRGHLDQSLVEQERLSHEVQRLASELARLNATVPADRDQQLIGLAKASQQLASEQEKVLVLTRSLMETLQQADSARGRTLELQDALDRRTSERDQLQHELDRQRAELTDLRLGIGSSGGSRSLPPDELQPNLLKRDQALIELEQVRKELAEARARLSENARTSSTLENLGNEHARIRAMTAELEQLRSESEQRQQMFNEARARLVQVSSERDRLAAELAELKSRPDQSVELKMLRRRLIRAKRIIKQLRRERDEALAERMKSATNLHELTGQIERMKSAQRAAAEALGLQLPPDQHGFTTGHLAAAIQPAMQLSMQPTAGGSTAPTHVPKAVTQRIAALGGGFTSAFGKPTISGMGSGATPAVPGHASPLQPRQATRRVLSETPPNAHAGLGFTSAYGKPAIPGAGTEGPVGMTTAPHGTLVLEPRRRANGWAFLPTLKGRPWRLTAVVATAAMIGTFFLAPPLIPISSQGIVNARINAITAPIEGRFSAATPTLGDGIVRNQTIGVIRNDHVDTTALDAALAKLGTATVKRSDIAERTVALTQERNQLDQQIDIYRTGLIDDLARRLVDEERQLTARKEALSLATATSLTGARAALDAQSQLVDGLGARLQALRSGQFADADQPTANRRRDEVVQKLAALAEEDAILVRTAETLSDDIARERTRITALTEAQVQSLAAGILWSRKAGDQQWLKTSEEIAQIADPDTILVEAVMHERYLSEIQPGDQVEIELTGERRRVRGTVKDLRPLSDPAQGMATSVSTLLPNHFKLRIQPDSTSGQITVGQGVKVMVTGSNPGWFRRLLAWGYGETRF